MGIFAITWPKTSGGWYMAQFTYPTRQSQPAKQRAAILTTQLRTRLVNLIFTTHLLRQPVHFKIALRSDSEGIRNSIEEREHCGDIHSLSDLRLRPTMISQHLHIIVRGAIRRFRHLGYIVEQCAFRSAQACFFQFALRDGLYGFVFCSLKIGRASCRERADTAGGA